MSSDDTVIDVKNLSKRYEIYATPRDRLKQLVLPALHSVWSRLNLLSRFKNDRQPPQYFQEFWALHDVSFQVRKGEMVGVIGLNGSGKSTLLQLICSIVAPTSGSVKVKGRVAALLELGSGFNPEYSGRENVYLNGQILGLRREEIQDRFETIESFADIGDFIDRPVKTYSSGMVLRLAFAVAINVDPEILVVDEALAVGDVGFQVRCFNKIRELREKGTTFFLVSHSPSVITELCGRAILLHQGQLLLDCEPYRAISAYTLLCNADDLDRKKIISDISQLQKRWDKPGEISISGEMHERKFGEDVQPESLGAYFDEGLSRAVAPRSMNDMGVTINDVWIETIDGSQVNVLPQGHCGMLKFTVRFSQPAACCRLAWTLRTTKGLILGGGSTHSPGEGSAFKQEEIEVSSQFHNYFSPGEYVIDISVRGGGSTNNAHLCAISDAIIFRSVMNAKLWRNGIVNCLVENGFRVRYGNGNVETYT